MFDPRITKLAKVIVQYSTNINEGDEVVINAQISALPLVREIYREVLRVGGYPITLLGDEILEEIFYKTASTKQLKHITPFHRIVVEKAAVFINILSTLNVRRLNTIDPERIKIYNAARAELLKIFMEREAKGELRWIVVPYPTPSMAQEAGMGTIDFEDFVYRACYVDKDDPVKVWHEISNKQKKIIDYLQAVNELHIVGPETNLTLSITGRKWINADGKKNMPDGEIFTSPIEDSADGTIKFTYPVLYRGFEIKGVKLKFKDGIVVEVSASEGEKFLRKLIEVDEGAKRLGEVAFGMNYEIKTFTKQILFDEKIGGTIHLAIGRGFPEAGGKNFSTIHIDMIKNMREGKVFADGELIYVNGKFTSFEA